MGGGSKTTQVNTLEPKTEQQKALEGQFYGMSNMLLDGFTKPLGGGDRVVSGGKGGNAGMPAAATKQQAAPVQEYGPENEDGYRRPFPAMTQPAAQAQAQTAQSAASNGKGGNTRPGQRGDGIPQPYDNNTMYGQLLNDATLKTYQSNKRYNDLFNSADSYTKASDDALAQQRNATDMSRTAGDKYFSMADTAYGDAQKYMDEGAGYLRQAPHAGDEWYGRAKDVYGKAEGFLDEDRGYIRKADTANQWYDDYTRRMLGGAENMLSTGDIPAPILAAMQGNVKSGLDKSMGAGLNDWASRGIINSSVANKGLSDMSQAGADALQRSYLDSFNSILGGYNQTAGTSAQAGKTFTDSLLDIARTGNANTQNAIGLGDSYAKTGNMRVNDMLNTAKGFGDYSNLATQRGGSLMNAGSSRIADWLNIGKGYGDLSANNLKALTTNIGEREYLSKAIPGYWENAFAPARPAYDFMKTMQADRHQDKKDTIVKGKG